MPNGKKQMLNSNTPLATLISKILFINPILKTVRPNLKRVI